MKEKNRENREGRKVNMRNYRKERAQAREKAKKLVAEMTLMEKAAQLKYDAAPVKRLGVPAYNYWNEALHGVARAGTATMFPQAIGMAAAFDEDIMEKVGDIIATEGRAKYNASHEPLHRWRATSHEPLHGGGPPPMTVRPKAGTPGVRTA